MPPDKTITFFDNIINDPFKLVPFAFNILCKFQPTAGTTRIMFGISASEILSLVILSSKNLSESSMVIENVALTR